MSQRILTGAALATVIAVAAACTSSPSDSPSPTAASSASAAASVAASPTPLPSDPGALLFGSWTAAIPAGVNASPGTWTLTVSATGVNFTHPDGHGFSPGALIELTASEMKLAADLGCPDQVGTPTAGHYRWTRDGDALTFEVVSDTCQDRVDVLTTSEWTVKP